MYGKVNTRIYRFFPENSDLCICIHASTVGIYWSKYCATQFAVVTTFCVLLAYSKYCTVQSDLVKWTAELQYVHVYSTAAGNTHTAVHVYICTYVRGRFVYLNDT